MRALLDVNFVIALLDPDHVHNDRAHEWWAINRDLGWASCPVTENGVVRILSNPNYSQSTTFSPSESINRLIELTTLNDHQFWHDDISIRDSNILAVDRIHGPKQLTDLYLLALATQHKARLVTFDQSIPLSAVKGAKATNLCVA